MTLRRRRLPLRGLSVAAFVVTIAATPVIAKPKEIVVVGSKIESATFRMPYTFGPGSRLSLANNASGEVSRYNFFEAWPTKTAYSHPRTTLVELGVAQDGRPVGRLTAKLECAPASTAKSAAETEPVQATLSDLGFSESTPIVVTPRGKGHLLRFGEAVSRHGRCSLSAVLVPEKERTR